MVRTTTDNIKISSVLEFGVWRWLVVVAVDGSSVGVVVEVGGGEKFQKNILFQMS